MKKVAKRLNLSGHTAGIKETTSCFLYSCVDTEGHLGRDGRYYVIDLARLSPPEYYERNS